MSDRIRPQTHVSEADPLGEAVAVNGLGRSPRGRLLAAALMGAGVLLRPATPPAEAAQVYSITATSTSREKRSPRREQGSSESPEVESLESAWGIPREQFLHWQQASFPQALSQAGILRAVRVEPQDESVTRGYFGRESHHANDLLAGRTQIIDGAAEVSLFPQAFQPDTTNMTAGEYRDAAFYHAYGADRRFDTVVRTLYHEYTHVLLTGVNGPGRERLSHILRTAPTEVADGYLKGFIHRGHISVERLPIATDELIGVIGEEAFHVVGAETDGQFKHALLLRLAARTRLRGPKAQVFLEQAIDGFIALMRQAHPEFSFRATAAARKAGEQVLRERYRRHEVQQAFAILKLDVGLQEVVQQFFDQPRDEWSLLERVAQIDPLKLAFNDRVFLHSLLPGTDAELSGSMRAGRELRESVASFSDTDEDEMTTNVVDGLIHGHWQTNAVPETRATYQAVTAWERVRSELRSLRRGLMHSDTEIMAREDFSSHHRGLVVALEAFTQAWSALPTAERQRLRPALRSLDRLYSGDAHSFTAKERHHLESLINTV